MSKKLLIKELNPHITCILCGGYYIDATTIVQCLHSFCRTCIIPYLSNNRYCPVCEVLIHKKKPFKNLRRDPVLQSLVYKLVPNLYKDEVNKRTEFKGQHSENSSACPKMLENQIFYSPTDEFSLSIEYNPWLKGDEINTSNTTRRYLQCCGAVTVNLLTKFIATKYNVPSTYYVEMLFHKDKLREDLSLIDIAYIFSWKRTGPLKLFYQITKKTSNKCFSNSQKEATNSLIVSSINNASSSAEPSISCEVQRPEIVLSSPIKTIQTSNLNNKLNGIKKGHTVKDILGDHLIEESPLISKQDKYAEDTDDSGRGSFVSNYLSGSRSSCSEDIDSPLHYQDLLKSPMPLSSLALDLSPMTPPPTPVRKAWLDKPLNILPKPSDSKSSKNPKKMHNKNRLSSCSLIAFNPDPDSLCQKLVIRNIGHSSHKKHPYNKNPLPSNNPS